MKIYKVINGKIVEKECMQCGVGFQIQDGWSETVPEMKKAAPKKAKRKVKRNDKKD